MAISSSRLLLEHWDGRLPVRPEAIAEAIGVEVRPEFGIEDGVSGLAFVENGRPVIAYNILEPYVRQRFSLAHELGHVALDHLSGGVTRFRDTRENFTASNRDPQEIAANQFAAAILMPSEMVEFAVRTQGISSVEELANMFAVSTAAMKFRLLNLNLIDPRFVA